MSRAAISVHPIPAVSVALTLLAALVGAGLASCSDASSVKSRTPSKVSRELLSLYDGYMEARRSGTPLCPDTPRLRIDEDRVIVDATATVGNAQSLEADLVALGMRHAVAYERVVSGGLPIASIPALEALGSLAFVRAAMGIPSGTAAGPCNR
jgi:hypothetical protein